MWRAGLFGLPQVKREKVGASSRSRSVFLRVDSADNTVGVVLFGRSLVWCIILSLTWFETAEINFNFWSDLLVTWYIYMYTRSGAAHAHWTDLVSKSPQCHGSSGRHDYKVRRAAATAMTTGSIDPCQQYHSVTMIACNSCFDCVLNSFDWYQFRGP